MTTYSEATVLMNQVDEEAGYDHKPTLQQQPAAAVANSAISDAELGVMHRKGKRSFILAIVSFIACFCCGLGALSPYMICHIAAMLFAAKSRVSAEKKDYYDSKLMLHWSYIFTSAGCFLGVIFSLGGGYLFLSGIVLMYRAIDRNYN